MHGNLYRCMITASCPSVPFSSNEAFLGVSICTGIEEIASKTGVYPNPSNGSFYVIANPEDYQTLRMFTSFGQEVFTTRIETERSFINPGNINPGIYIIRFEGKNKSSIKKIVISR